MDAERAIIQVVGYKNSGKTTMCCKLIKHFSEKGWKVGSVKSDAHHFEIDYPGKDTWLHREAGATIVAIASDHKTAIMEQRPTRLDQLIERMDGMDMIVIEGYKFEKYPKVVMIRSEEDLPLIEETTEIVAIVSWFPFEHPSIPVIHIDDDSNLLPIIEQRVQKQLERKEPSMKHFAITNEKIEIQPLIDLVTHPRAGAVSTFIGMVREFTRGRKTLYLEYQAYAEMAEKKLKEIGDEIVRKHPEARVAIHHRVGRLEISDVAVAIAVSTPHRDAAFEASRYAIERIKEMVPIWKKENWEDGQEWIGDQKEQVPYPTGKPEGREWD